MAPRSIFGKAVLFVATLVPMLGNAQFVALEGRKFILDGQEFYPRVMNYGVDFACNVNGSADNLYVAAASAYDYSVPGDLECSDAATCAEQLRRHFDKLNGMNFNTIRLLCGVVSIVSGGRKFGLTVRYNNPAWGGDSQYDLLLGSPAFNDAISTNYFAGVRNVLDIAQEKNLKVILLGADNKGGGDWTPGDDWDAVHRYSEFLKRLAQELDDHPALLAYDLWNEPRWTHINDGTGFNQWSKPSVCAITSEWYDAIREYDSNHLVTLGTSGWDDLWHWDPNVMKLDFASLHVYPEQYNVDGYSYTHMLNRVRAQIYWHGAAIPMPFIIGETSFSAEDSNDDNFDDPFNHHLVDDPAHDYPPWRDGPESQQSVYASQTMTSTRAYLGSGFSWWDFQNHRGANLTPPVPPTPANMQSWRGAYRGNFYGALKYGDENANPPIPWEDKLVAGTFSTYSLPSAPSTLPTPPADYYRGKFNGSLSSGNIIRTTMLRDQENRLISGAVAWCKVRYITTNNGSYVGDYYAWNVSQPNGQLDLLSGPNISLSSVSQHQVRIHVPGGTTTITYEWPWHVPTTLQLSRARLTFNDEVAGVTVAIGQSYSPVAWSTLTLSGTTYLGSGELGANGDVRARQWIKLDPEFHVQHGAEVHIWPDAVFPDCSSPHMLMAPVEQDEPAISKTKANGSADSQIELHFDMAAHPPLNVAPNPARDRIVITGLMQGEEFVLLSSTGSVVLSGSCTSKSMALDLRSLAPASYTIRTMARGIPVAAQFIKLP